VNRIFWQDQPLDLDLHEENGDAWLSLDALTRALDGHLLELPGETIGFCLPDDRCLPLRGDDLRRTEQETQVRLAALAALGIVAEGAPPAGQMLLGDPLPDLTMPTLDGQPVALRDLIGKPTLLFAWASW
jgi:hypothetical protein